MKNIMLHIFGKFIINQIYPLLGSDPGLVIVNLISILTGDESEDFCDRCISDFDEAGGCECMEDNDCDQFSQIFVDQFSDECFKCRDKAIKYCLSKDGENV